jgi:uncharacterized protein YjaG (DUF416 family)
MIKVSFDPDLLEREISRLPRTHRVVFAAACCERLLPNYAAFVREAHWGDVRLLRSALDYIWSAVAGVSVEGDEIHRLIEQCDAVIPDTEDFETSLVSAALDAGTAVVGTLRSSLDGETKHVVEVASYCRDTVHMYIQGRDELDDGDPLFDTKIERDPLMKRELERQAAVLSELANNPILDGRMVKSIRDEAADGGRSNIGLIADPPS